MNGIHIEGKKKKKKEKKKKTKLNHLSHKYLQVISLNKKEKLETHI